MRTRYIIACLWATLAIPLAYAQKQTSVAVSTQGETVVAASAGKLAVQVRIKTHEVSIGKPSDPRPAIIDSSCTYSRYPCSIVDRLAILVNGTQLFVPRSAFCDLADVNKAKIEVGEKGAILRLEGGDGAEAFIVKVEFDKTRVRRRTIAAGESADQLLQETNYHALVFD
jgi:hypothetical protein